MQLLKQRHNSLKFAKTKNSWSNFVNRTQLCNEKEMQGEQLTRVVDVLGF